MARKAREQGWLLDTYGEIVTPWECSLLISNADKTVFGKKNLSITYSYQRTLNGKKFTERIENRKIEIRDPGQYFGQLGQQQSSE